MDLDLTRQERDRLVGIVARPVDANQLKRAQGILAVADGDSPSAIALRLQVTRATVYNWVNRFRNRQGAVEQALIDQPRSGRPAELFEQVAERLRTLMTQTPGEFGYRNSQWTTTLLVAHLKSGGVCASEDTVRRALHELGYRWKRPRYVLRRRSPTWKQSKGGSSAA